MLCGGAGSPAVIFDAALGASSVSWTLVQPEVARLTRACSYDRGGFGWSDAGPLPRTAQVIAAELRTLLARDGVPPPYVLVGHSFGGLVMRIFAAAHPEDVAGLVLVDPAHPEEWVEPDDARRHQIERGARLCRYGVTAARVGIAELVSRLVSSGALAPARALAGLVSRGGLSRADEEILAPMWKLPSDARKVLPQFWTDPKFFEALGSQIASVCESAAQARDAHIRADLPLIVISAATASDRRRALHDGLARTSSRGEHRIARHSGHWIPLDEPQVVIEAVRDVVRACRR